MVEVEILFASALDATTLIPFPHLEFHRRRDHSVMIYKGIGIRIQLGLLVYDFEFKFEHLSMA